MTIRTKQELLALFADNTTGDISEQDMRDFVESNLVNEAYTAMTNDDLPPQADIAYLPAGVNAVTLPLIADYKQRTLIVANNSGVQATITAAGSNKIDGQNSAVLENKTALMLAPGGIAGNWFSVISTGAALADTDSLTEGSSNLYYTEARVSANTDVAANTAKRSYPQADEDKLAAIEAGAEANNISDVDATDLTDGGETTLHTHPTVAAGLGYVLATWGANLQNTGRHPAINGVASTPEISSLGVSASVPVPAAGTIDTLTYYSSTGDNTTAFQIIKNGAVAHTFTCTGPYGVETGIGVPTGFVGAVPDNIAIRYASGTAPGGCFIAAYIK